MSLESGVPPSNSTAEAPASHRVGRITEVMRDTGGATVEHSAELGLEPAPVLWPPVEPAPSLFPEHTPAPQAAQNDACSNSLGRIASLRRYFRVGVRGTLGLAVLYGLLFNFSVVRGSSMSPSIFDGDRILIDHFSYLFSDVHRGDIIVLQYPLDPKLDYIKRVVGLPGDEIVIDRGQVFVNGERLHEEYVDVPDLRSKLQTVVRDDHFFVLGDNRCHSSDSREFGQVPGENLLGKVDLRVWPLGRIGLID